MKNAGRNMKFKSTTRYLESTDMWRVFGAEVFEVAKVFAAVKQAEKINGKQSRARALEVVS